MDMDNSVDYERYNMFCKTSCPLVCKKLIKGTEKCPVILFDSYMKSTE